MNKGKAIMAGIVAVVAITASAATITGVTAKQLHPWDRKVYISYTLTGNIEEELPDAYVVNAVQLTATDRANNTNYIAVAGAVFGDTGTEEGVHHVVWDLNAQGLEFASDDVVFTVAYKYYAKYCVVDVSAVSSAYSVDYTMEPPSGGFNTETYKTTKLVLRLIKQYSPYYIGIFEVTQSQYKKVTGEIPPPSMYGVERALKWHGVGDTLPVVVSWNMIRGDSSIYDWPSSRAVDPSSFVGCIQTRTGLNFDLPTESQWEYACTNGTKIGRYADNGGVDFRSGVSEDGGFWYSVSIGGAVAVGSYHENDWGLYDMRGNVRELCLDYYDKDDSLFPDARVSRGGDWGASAECCSPSLRCLAEPYNSGLLPVGAESDDLWNFLNLPPQGPYDTRPLVRSIADRFEVFGFRLVMMPQVVSCGVSSCYGDSASISVDSRIEPVVDAVNLLWDVSWVGGDVNATIAIADNGAEVMRTIGVGEFTHVLSGIGRHDLTYTTYIDGVAQDEIYSATVFKDWRYEVKAGGAVIVKTSQTTGAVTIPSTIDGHPVTGIAAGVFAGCTNLTSVTIPASVWHVGHGVFKDCTGLRRVEAVKGQKWMLESQDAFAGCSPELEIVYASTAEVRDVVAKQRFPWNGKVDIAYTLTGDLSVGLPESHIIALGVTATNRVDGTFYVATPDALSGDTGTEQGTHHVVWDLDAQGIEFNSDDVVFTVVYAIPQYCVVDLSAGADAPQYPITYWMEPPSGGFNADEYKTTKLALRLINPGKFMMVGKYDVMVTKPFYCGIFEVTQRQYELVAGNPPLGLEGDMLPVEVSWNTIRGNSNIYNWPTSANVGPSSFVGKLLARTGLNFDLPTEAQWEYACRAGTTSKYNNGGNAESDLKTLGRYKDNRSDGKGGYAYDTKVGSYLPNAWGLYDMHGNEYEWCLDWSGKRASGMDPVGPLTGTDRVIRGGNSACSASGCTSSSSAYEAPSGHNDSWVYGYHGFRLVRTLSNTENEQKPVAVAGAERDDALCVGDSASVAVDSRIEPLVDVIAIRWDASWIGGDANATVVISDNGVEVRRATGAGEFMHVFSGIGRHELTYTTYVGGAAQDEVYTATVYAKWKYDVKDGGAVVAETTQTAGAITIPSAIDGYPVTGIAVGAFANCSELTSVKIPASVWDVGYAAFGHCTGLQHVEAARGLRGMLESRAAFAWCSPELQIDYFTTAEIRNVVAKQRFPWNGKVDITYEISGDLTAGCPSWRLPSFLIFATNRLEDTLYVSVADALSGDIGTTAGVHHVTWDMALQGIEFKSDDVVFSVVYGDEAALYEKWTTPSTVTFDRQGGSGGSWAVTARHGSAMPSITVPARSGYSFGGYWSDTNGSGVQFYTASGTSARTWGNFGAMTLYAKWTGNAYVVTLDQQSGSGGTTNVTATYGSAMPAITVPMRTGYIFGGYWSEPNGEGMQYYTASGASALAWDKTNGAILYAKWTEAEKYTVTFDRQGGSGGAASVIAMYGSVMPYIAVPTRTGYAFGGYWSGPNGSGTQYYTPSGTSAHVWDKANATTLYAQWVEQ